MTGQQTVRALAWETALPKATVSAFFTALQALAVTEASRGFTVPGIGKLTLSNRKARMGRNPQTGEAIKIPAKRVCKFRLVKGIKGAVMAGGGE